MSLDPDAIKSGLNRTMNVLGMGCDQQCILRSAGVLQCCLAVKVDLRFPCAEVVHRYNVINQVFDAVIVDQFFGIGPGAVGEHDGLAA